MFDKGRRPGELRINRPTAGRRRKGDTTPRKTGHALDCTVDHRQAHGGGFVNRGRVLDRLSVTGPGGGGPALPAVAAIHGGPCSTTFVVA